jgi:glycosyltransferase involved in cell wall biosynthesis
MSVLASVGLPFYNDRAYLKDAIKSVLKQSYDNWELLLVDDGSSDGSLEIARSFKDSRIHLISHATNRGLACRLNEISMMANGEYLFRMDADDIMHPRRIERQLQVLINSAPDTVIGTAAIEIDPYGRLTRIIRSRGIRRGGYSARSAFIHPTIAARTLWFRRNPYSEAPIFRRTQDAELWVRSASNSEFRLMEEPLFFYRRPGSISFEKYLWQALALIAILATSPNAGGQVVRLYHCALELLKLQMRFIAHMFGGKRSLLKSSPTDNMQLREYRTLLDELQKN